MKGSSKTFIQIAADYGAVLGILFIVAFFAAIYALRVQALSIVSLIAMIAVPVVTWIMLKRTWRKSLCTMPFSAMWTEGIVAFACGGIIFAVATFIYLKWIEPDVLINALEQQVERWAAAGTDESTANAKALRLMIDNGGIPTASEIALQLVCLTVFTGSMLSMLQSIIVRLTGMKKPKK